MRTLIVIGSQTYEPPSDIDAYRGSCSPVKRRDNLRAFVWLALGVSFIVTCEWIGFKVIDWFLFR